MHPNGYSCIGKCRRQQRRQQANAASCSPQAAQAPQPHHHHHPTTGRTACRPPCRTRSPALLATAACFLLLAATPSPLTATASPALPFPTLQLPQPLALLAPGPLPVPPPPEEAPPFVGPWSAPPHPCFDPGAYVDYNRKRLELPEEVVASTRVDAEVPDPLTWQRRRHQCPDDALTSDAWAAAELQYRALPMARAASSVCNRVPVTLSYWTPGGLCNQLFAGIGMWALAAELGADVILPPMILHQSYAKYGNLRHVAFASVVNLEHLRQMLHGLGVNATLAPWQEGGKAKSTVPDSAQLLKRSFKRRFPNQLALKLQLPKAPYDMHQMREMAASSVLQMAREVVNTEAWDAARSARARASDSPVHVLDANPPCTLVPLVNLQVDGPLLALRASSSPVASYLAAGLRFSPEVEAAAEAVLVAMRERGITRFNAIHLRVEGDAHWDRHYGGKTKLIKEYVRTAAALGFRRDEPLYLASGLRSYEGGREIWEAAAERLRAVASLVVDKEGLLAVPGASFTGELPAGASPATQHTIADEQLGEEWIGGARATRSTSRRAARHRARALLSSDGDNNGRRDDDEGDGDDATAAAADGGDIKGSEGGGEGDDDDGSPPPPPPPLVRAGLGALAGLHNEQAAAVDMLILERAARFVGLGHSSLSVLVVERRRLAGLRDDSGALVGGRYGRLKDAAVFSKLQEPAGR